MAQLQGGLIFGLTAALYGEITIDKGRVQQIATSTTTGCCGSTRRRRSRCIVIKSGEAPGGIGETGATAGTAGAAQRDLRGDRRRAAPAADRPQRCLREEARHECHARRASLIVVLIVADRRGGVASAEDFRHGPLAFAGGRTVALADYHAADPTGVPAESRQGRPGRARRISHPRRRLHGLPHRAGRRAYSPAAGLPLPFGTIYSTNITPDKDTGIGNYSDAGFSRRLAPRHPA